MESKTEVVVKKKQMPAVINTEIDVTDSTDLILPSALVLQKTSKLVDSGKGNPGDIIEGSNYTMLAKKGEALEIIPVYTYYDWTKVMKDAKDPSKWVFLSRAATPAVMPERGKWSVEAKENGVDVKYFKTVYMFACLTRDLDAVPVRFSFKGMSANSGKKVSSHFQMSNKLNVSPCRFTFNISTQLSTYNGNTSFAIEFLQGKKATEGQVSQAKIWRQSFGEVKNIAVRESGDERDDETVPF